VSGGRLLMFDSFFLAHTLRHLRRNPHHFRGLASLLDRKIRKSISSPLWGRWVSEYAVFDLVMYMYIQSQSQQHLEGSRWGRSCGRDERDSCNERFEQLNLMLESFVKVVFVSKHA
jgi:hypothetical protein